jgi:hypothetical protein
MTGFDKGDILLRQAGPFGYLRLGHTGLDPGISRAHR